jgi:hypothetical protein
MSIVGLMRGVCWHTRKSRAISSILNTKGEAALAGCVSMPVVGSCEELLAQHEMLMRGAFDVHSGAHARDCWHVMKSRGISFILNTRVVRMLLRGAFDVRSGLMRGVAGTP